MIVTVTVTQVLCTLSIRQFVLQILQQGLISNREFVNTQQRGIPLPDVGLELNCSSDSWPPCRIIRGVNATRQKDPNVQADFVDLMPSHSFLGMESGERLKVLGTTRHQYDLRSFPPTIGPSFTISVWANIQSSQDSKSAASTYLISKSLSSASSVRCWSMNIGQTRVGLYAGEVANGELTQNALVYFPPNIDANYYRLTDGPVLRHIVLVADSKAGMVRGYMDGELIGETPHPNISALDCPSHPGAYIALMHRAPGSHDWVGDIQQPRLYPGAALTSEQVAAIHDNSVDPKSGRQLRECSHVNEGFDSAFHDLLGHDCAWFSEAVKTNPQVCTFLGVCVRARAYVLHVQRPTILFVEEHQACRVFLISDLRTVNDTGLPGSQRREQLFSCMSD